MPISIKECLTREERVKFLEEEQKRISEKYKSEEQEEEKQFKRTPYQTFQE
jgi:hypothetical protein